MVADIAKHKEMPQYFNPENIDCEVVLGLLSLFVHAKVNFTFVYAPKAAFKRYECFDKRLQLHSYEGCEAPSMKELLTLLYDANETYSTPASQAGTMSFTVSPSQASASPTPMSNTAAFDGPVLPAPDDDYKGPYAALISRMAAACVARPNFESPRCSYKVKLYVVLNHVFGIRTHSVTYSPALDLQRSICFELASSYHFPAFKSDGPLAKRKRLSSEIEPGKLGLTASTLDEVFSILQTHLGHQHRSQPQNKAPHLGAIFILTEDFPDASTAGVYYFLQVLVGFLQMRQKSLKLVPFSRRCTQRLYDCEPDELDIQQSVFALGVNFFPFSIWTNTYTSVTGR